LQANADYLQINEEQSITIEVLQNDSITNVNNLSINILQNPLYGNAFLQSAPKVNDSPIAIDDIIVGSEEQISTFYPTQNDIDVDGDSLTIQLGTPPRHGNFSLGTNSGLIYLPDTNFIGWDTLSYLTCDSTQLCDEALVYILVEAVNDPPIIITETFETDMGKAVEINLLENDFDEENYNLSLSIISGPLNGSISGNIQSNFSYLPTVNFTGIDSIFYAVCDDGYPVACDTGFATIYVNVNQRPIAINDTIYVTDVEPATISILNNDFDPDNNQLFYVLNQLNNNQTQKGKVFDEGNGRIRYQAKRAYNGMDKFTYTLFDDGGLPQLSSEGTVYVIANKTNLPPIVLADTVRLDQAATIQFNVLENDNDPENDPLKLNIEEYPQGGALNFNQEGDLTYVGNYYFYGQDYLTYQLCDSTDNCVTTSVIIEVNQLSIDDLLGAIPNVITPNNDGKNDFFKIRNIESYPNNTLLILNRWGQMVYETTNYQNNWNGQALNSENTSQTNGTYYYILSIVTPLNEVKEQRGFIQIMQ